MTTTQIVGFNQNLSSSGIPQPQINAMIAGTPRDSAYQSMKIASSAQAQNNKLMAGGKYKYKSKNNKFKNKKKNKNMKIERKKTKRNKTKRKMKKEKIYRGGDIAVPQFVPLYNSGGTDPNQLITGSSQIHSQSAANRVGDIHATNVTRNAIKGGSRKKNRSS